MEKNLQYYLNIKNGEIEQEEGFFFRAGSFLIIKGEQTIDCSFTNEDIETVVYEVKKSGESLASLTHPDYVPEVKRGTYTDIQTLSGDQKTIYAAFVKLGITKEKTYIDYFADEANQSYRTFEIKQEQFIQNK
jgi:hypothetical protein